MKKHGVYTKSCKTKFNAKQGRNSQWQTQNASSMTKGKNGPDVTVQRSGITGHN